MAFHHATLAAFERASREAETLASMAEDKIMIVAGRRQAGIHPAGADGGGLSEVQGRAEDGQQLPGGNQTTVYFGGLVRGDL